MAQSIIIKQYKSKDYNIPFQELEGNKWIHRLRIKVDHITSAADLETKRSILKGQAVRRYVTYYFPELYTYLYREDLFQEFANADLDVAQEVIAEIKESIHVNGFFDTSPKTNKSIVIFSTNFNFAKKRQELDVANLLPSFEDNLRFFNEQSEISEATSQTTLVIGTLGSENTLLNNGLRTFDTQYRNFEGQIDLNIDFGTLQVSSQKILNILITELTKQLRSSTSTTNFSEADTVTILFGKKNGKIALAGINYLLIEESIQSKPLKVGYFSIAKFNKLLHDPMSLAILQNYKAIIDSVQDTSSNNTNYSFYDFITNDEVQFALDHQPTIFDFKPQPKKDLQNQMLEVAAQYGLIDTDNTEELEKGFKNYFTSEEYKKLKKEIADNPDIYKRVSAKQKALVLNTAVNVTKVVGSVLETGPMGFVDKNPVAKYLFRQLGLDELAKEAFLCLTFGVNFEVGRINKAIQNALVKSSASIYYPPDLPKSSITKPKIDPKLFNPFTISGDIWKEILKIIVDSLQEAVLQIIKQLAELLRENCSLNNPRASDHGNTDIADLLDPENTQLPFLGDGSQLDSIAKNNGFTNEELIQYLRDLSSILSSMEICILFQDRENSPQELIERIIDFNTDYSLPIVNETLVTISSVMGFFAKLSSIIDVTDLCNQIANEIYLLNQDNICLTEGDLEDENLADLLDLIENGLLVEPPPVNLECPDREGFLADPTIVKSIPETFNVLAEVVELQFISSATSVREILLEPVVGKDPNSSVLKNAAFAKADTGSLNTQVDTGVLTKIIGVFSALSEFEPSGCPVSISEILGFDAATAIGVAEAAVDVIGETLQDAEFQNAISSLNNKLESISASANDPSPIFTTYKFNQQFYNEFVNYIDINTFSYTATNSSSSTNNYYDSYVDDIWVADGTYKPVTLEFRFPSLDSRSKLNDDYLRLRYPNSISQTNFEIDFKSSGNFIPTTSFSTAVLQNLTDVGSIEYTDNRNIYLTSIIDSFTGNPALSFSDAMIETDIFPNIYAIFIDNVFDYIKDNGVFDAATLQSLNFFHLNKGCPPSEISDLLDIEGILEQLRKEYAESACSGEETPVSKKIRNLIKLGMYLLLIQIHIAEFIVKNIFVFSAFTIDSLIEDKDGFIYKFFRSQITQSVLKYFDNQAGSDGHILRNDLVSYFNLKMQRSQIIQSGGIRFTDGEIAFPDGTQFSITVNSPFPGIDEIIDYLISERLTIGKAAVNNAIKNSLPNRTPISFDEALLESTPVYTITDIQDTVAGISSLDSSIPSDSIFITRKQITEQHNRFRLWYRVKDSSEVVLLKTLGNIYKVQ
jgi:hypothetical protein